MILIWNTKRLITLLILVCLILVFLFAVHSYLKRSAIIENGLVIESFSENDKKTICSFFDIEENEDLKFESFEYQQWFKGSDIKLYVKSKYNEQRNLTLTNYKTYDINYSLDGFHFNIDQQYIRCEQLVNETNLHKHVFVFYYQEDVLIVFYSNQGDNEIQNYVDMQISSGNFKEKYFNGEIIR